MRTTITKTVSIMLVTVMVLGIVAMPMRAHADLLDPVIDMIPDPVWREVVRITKDIGKEMLNPVSNSPDTSAISRFSAFFEPDLTSDLYYVTAEQMNELSYWLVQNGISVMPTSVPGRNLIALCVQNTSVFIPAIDTTIQLDVNVGDMYTYSGKTIVRIPGGSAAEEDRDSYTGNGSTSNNVGIGDDGQLVDVPTTDKDTGTTVGGGTFIHNETTNNWQVKNENGTYVDIEEFYYNPVTQTYHTTTNEWNSTTNNYDQRQYTYQFYYDYTYITYIGSSAEYREAYKVYFELPDGRSSGDLTVDELKGISLQFDMVNYDKSASDTLTQALFNFDGNSENSSFYSSSFDWVTGSSISYLESPDPFGGNLYIPGSVQPRFNMRFTRELEDLSQGFSIQFRLYLNDAEASDSIRVFLRGDFIGYNGSNTTSGSRSWVSAFDQYRPLFAIASNRLISFDVPPGGTLDGGTVSNLTVGEWYDICITYIGHDYDYRPGSGWPLEPDTVYYYVNGNLAASRSLYGYVSNNTASNNAYGYYLTDSSLLQNGFHTWIPYRCVTLNGLSFYSNSTSVPSYQLDNFRVVYHGLYAGVSSYTVPQAPFDTNLVYVLPSVADLNDNTVAIMSQLPVSGYRVGGIRPTDPTLASGYIYMHIDGDFVDSVQQWNGAYWEEVTARLYTGIRWIPVTAFNVFTLEDMFDIIDPDADGSGPGVDSIFHYYLWWSGEWGTFQEWLKGTMQTLIEAIQASGGGGGSTDAPVVIVPGVNDQTTTSEITTENPDGSTTKTTIVSNAAGLVYSNSVTTYPTDANGNTKTITVYTDSSGVMYQTETIIDKDGNVTVTEPTKATGTLGSILKMITGGVMEIAGTVIEGFVTIVVDGVKFIIEAADGLFDGIGDLFTTMFGAVTDFTDSVQDYVNPPGSGTTADGETPETVNIFDAFFQVLPDWLVTGVTLCFVMMIVFPLMNKIHF